MKKFNAERITLDRTNTGYGNKKRFTTTDQYFIVDKNEIKKYLDFVKMKKTKHLSQDDKVYIMSSDSILTNPFKKIYSDMITKKRDCSTVIICNDDDLYVDTLEHLYSKDFDLYECEDGHYSMDANCPTIVPNGKIFENKILLDESIVKYVSSKCKLLSTRVIMDPCDICYGGEIITDEAYYKISTMLKSNDKEVRELGRNLISAFDYNSCKDRFAAIISGRLLEMYDYNPWCDDYDDVEAEERKNEEFYHLVERVMNEYYDMDFGEDWNFLMRLSINNPSDECIQWELSKMLSRKMDVEINVKVSKA
jgi:hypothetical protein